VLYGVISNIDKTSIRGFYGIHQHPYSEKLI